MKQVLQEMFPPGVPAVVRWRLMMCAVCMGFLAHIGLACGYFPGFSGFALAADVSALDDKVNTILVLSIETRLRELVQEQCHASTPSLRATLLQAIDELQAKHRALTGSNYTAVVVCES